MSRQVNPALVDCGEPPLHPQIIPTCDPAKPPGTRHAHRRGVSQKKLAPSLPGWGLSKTIEQAGSPKPPSLSFVGCFTKTNKEAEYGLSRTDT